MITTSFHPRFLLLLGSGALAALSADASADDDTHVPERQDLNVRGVFTSDLPDVGRKFSLRLLLHPHFGDLIKYDYFRTDLGLKYALSNRLELSGASATYFAHGLGDERFFEKFGVGELKFEAKYRLGDRLLPGWDSAVGGGWSCPINDPPLDVTDGLEHLRLFSTFARPVNGRADLRVFWGAGIDLVRETPTPGRHNKNDLRDDNQYLSGGFILHGERVHYTFEAKWTTTRLLGHTDEDVFEFRPGVIWDLGRTRDDGEPSRWKLGLAFSTTFGPDGTEFGLGARVRMDLDFKRIWRRGRRNSVEP